MQLTNRENSEKRTASILVADNNGHTLNSINKLLAHSGYKVSLCNNTDNVMSVLKNKSFNIILINVNANELSCLEFLGKIRNYDPDIPVMLMVDAANLTMAILAVKNGASDIIPKPCTPEELINYLEKTVDLCGPARIRKRSSCI